MKRQLMALILLFTALAVPALAADSASSTNSAAASGPAPMPTIAVEEIKPGQRGYGLSVFAGSEPERFEVEVVGVMRNNLGPNTSYILGRLTGKGLERIGVANGMSGSPVFIDGKLAGAVAFSWPFSHEAIAGITPIDAMRQLSGLGGMVPATPPPPVELKSLLAGQIPKDLLERELSRLRPTFAGGALPMVQWATSGFGERSQGVLQRALGSTTPAGKALPGAASKSLTLGGAVGAVLVDGDFQLAAIGTVTDRYGDQVLAFGHPFLGLGPIKVPMATAEVVTVLSNQYSSFKIANVGETVGAFEQDRKAGIQGRIGQSAPMVPMKLRIRMGDQEPREFNMRLAEVPQFTPMLVGSSVLAGLEAASYVSGTQSLDMTARFRLKGHGDLELRQSFDGDNAGTDVATFILAVAGYLVQNPLEQVSFESVDVELSQAPQPLAASLVGAHADRTVVHPGERINLNLDLVAYRGEKFRRSLTLDLPEDLPAGRYALVVGDGASIDATRLAIEPSDPVTFEQALRLLRSFHSRRDLMVLGVHAGSGLSVAGEVMPHLPGSVRSLWSAAASGSASPLRSTIAQEYREEMEVPVDGLVKVDLEVRRREPVTGKEGGKEGGEAGSEGQAAPATSAVAAGKTSSKGGKGGR